MPTQELQPRKTKERKPPPLPLIEDILQIDDEVSITIPRENRAWGYNPFPDGTKAEVIGFDEIIYGRLNSHGLKPGVYVNRSWVKLKLEDGCLHHEHSDRLKLSDQVEYKRRVKEWQESAPKHWYQQEEFIRELPETPFWEGDKVRVRARTALDVITREMPPEHDPEIFVVTRIDFNQLNKYIVTARGKRGKYPAYEISDKLGAGWNTSASEDNMELVERGNVWKFYHGEPLNFENLREEASFFERLGHTEEVRNPFTGVFSWKKMKC